MVNHPILVTSVFLDVESGYIYLRKNTRSWMIDPIMVFTLAMKVLTNIGCKILKLAGFLSQEIYILIKLIAMIKKT